MVPVDSGVGTVTSISTVSWAASPSFNSNCIKSAQSFSFKCIDFIDKGVGMRSDTDGHFFMPENVEAKSSPLSLSPVYSYPSKAILHCTALQFIITQNILLFVGDRAISIANIFVKIL